jgi:hypothetical protein
VTIGLGLYRADVNTGAPRRRTLWEEGRRPGGLVALAAGLALLAVAALDARIFDHVTLATDLVCVCPPLAMATVFGVLAMTARGAVGDPADGFLQALVSGLAHHARALVVGYGLTLGLLALRKVALANAGVLRSSATRGRGQRDRSAGSRHPVDAPVSR